MNVLTKFSKGAANAVGLSFGPSGSPECDKRCSFHPAKNGGCYAHRLEQFRPQLRVKLDRHVELGPEIIANAALSELRMRRSLGESITWLRVSPFGPVPRPSNVFPEFTESLRKLFAYCLDNAIAVHFPVESSSKRKFYQLLLDDLEVCVRQSIHSERSFLRHDGPATFTAGVGMTGPHLKRQRVLVARAIAKHRARLSGRKTVVCPYDTTPDSPLTRCGLCRACSDPQVDVVYLKH